MKLSTLVLLLFAFLLVPAMSLRATVLVSENWESYTSGSVVASPWSLTSGGGATPSASTDTVVNATINSVTSNWALIGNNATDEPVGNPGLKTSFTATSSLLSLSFEYSIPLNYGAGSQILLNLNSGSTVGISMVLGRNYARNGMAYFNAAGTNTSVGHTFSAGETITLTLANINVATSTYDIAWTSSTGASGSVSGAAFRNSVASFDNLTFGESSAVTSTSLIYLDNITLQTVPEPGAGVLLGMALLMGGWRFNRRG